MSSESTALLQNFIQTSGIHGLIHVNRSRGIEKAFWIIVLLITFCRTLYDVSMLVDGYVSENTMWMVMGTQNETAMLPHPALCLRIRPTEMSEMLNKKIKEVVRAAKNLTTVLKKNETSDILRWITSSDVHGDRLGDTFATCILLLTNMFAAIGRAEKAITLISNKERKLTWHSFVEDYEPQTSDYWADSIAIVRDYLVARRNIDFVQLRKSVAFAWLEQVGLVVNSSINKIPRKLGQGDVEFTWFGEDPFSVTDDITICFRLLHSEGFFIFNKNSSDLFSVKFTPTNTLNDELQSAVHGLDLLFSTDRTVPAALIRTHVLQMVFSNKDYKAYHVHYENIFHSTNLRKHPCETAHDTYFDCRGSCQIQHIVSSCGCHPLTWSFEGVKPSQLAGTPLCGLGAVDASSRHITDMQTCFNRIVKSNDTTKIQACYSKCLRPCTMLEYSFDQDDSPLRLKDPTWLDLTMKDFTYKVWTEILSMSSADFIGNLGGIIGVWNGACMLAYVDAFICIIKCLIYYAKRKLRAVIKQDNGDQSLSSKIDTANLGGDSPSIGLCDDFVETTAIFGIAQAHKGSLSEKVLWCVLIAIAVCFTAKNLIDLTVQYVEQETITDVNVKSERTVILPNTTMCFYMLPIMIYKASTPCLTLNNTKVNSTLAFYNVNVTDIPKWTLEHASNIDMQSHTGAFFLLASATLFQLSSREQTIAASLSSGTAQTAGNLSSYFSNPDDRNTNPSASELDTAIKAMDDLLLKRQVNVVQLKHALAVTWILRTKLSLMVNESAKYAVEDPNSIDITWFGQMPFTKDNAFILVCFRLKQAEEYFTFYANQSKQLSLRYDPNVMTNCGEVVPIYSLNLVSGADRSPTPYNLRQTISPIFTNAIVKVSLDELHIALSLPSRPCTTEAANFDCLGLCQAHYVKARCKCFPSAWMLDGTAIDSPRCNISLSISACQENQSHTRDAAEQQLDACVKRCPVACTTTTYTVERLSEDVTILNTVVLKMGNFQRKIFVEHYKMSASDFKAGVGGIIGVWTGACAIAYVHLLVFACKLLYKMYSKKFPSNIFTTKLRWNFTNRKPSPLEIEFSETSTITGIQYAHRAKMMEKIFWITLVAMSFGVLISDLTDLIVEYREENIYSSVALISEGKITFPDPVICLQTEETKLNELWANTATDYNFGKNISFSNIRKYIENKDINDIGTWSTPKDKDVNTHKAFVAATTYLLFGLSSKEIAGKTALTSLEQFAAQLRNLFVQKNVDIYKVRNAIAAFWLSDLELKFTKPSDGTKSFLNNSGNVTITYFGLNIFQLNDDWSYSICFRLYDNDATFFSFDETMNLNHDYFEADLSIQRSSDTTLPFQAIDFAFVQGRAATQFKQSASVYSCDLNVAEIHEVYVNYESLFTTTSHKSQSCSTTVAHIDCIIACKSMSIAQKCACTSFALQAKQTEAKSVPICGWTAAESTLYRPQEQTCLETLAADNNLQECIDECPVDCTTAWLEFQDVHWWKQGLSSISVQLSPTKLWYTHITQLVKMDTAALAANLGGVLGVWSGASLISYIHLLLFVIKWLTIRCLTRQAKMLNAVNVSNKAEFVTATNEHVDFWRPVVT